MDNGKTMMVYKIPYQKGDDNDEKGRERLLYSANFKI